jgi:hypothetical protein
MRKRAGRKEYKEKDREDGGRMAKRRWRGRRDTRGINKVLKRRFEGRG